MAWFGKMNKQAKNFTPFKLKRKLHWRTVAVRFFVALLLIGGGLYYFFNVTQAEAAWRDSSWLYRKKITIDHNKVPNTDQTNFPVTIDHRDIDLKNYAQTSGNDIMFTSSDGTTKLDHEIEKWDKTTGELVAWIRIPTLSHTTDTVIYMYYGNSSAADQSNKTGVWDSNYKGVWHLSESSTSSNRLDSTSNANALTNNASVTGGTGVLDGDNVFSGSNYLNRTNASQTGLSITGNITIEAWIKRSDFSINGVIGGKDGTSAGNLGYTLRTTTGSKVQMVLGTAANGSLTNSTSSNSVLNTNQWYHVVGVYDGTNSTLYLNAAVDKTGAYNGGIFNSTGDVEIGSRNGGSVLYTGDIDEFRISNIARSADWISTEYNNQNNPSTFYFIGSIEQGPLALYWNFDEGYGSTVHDATVNGITGTITSATWTNEDLCIIGKCLNFNGSTSKVVGTYNDKLDVSTNPFSVDLWFKHPNTISATQYLLSRYSGAGYKIYMNTSGFVCFGIDDDSSWGPDDSVCSTTSYADSTWHQVKAVKTSTPSIVLYIDGKQVGSTGSLTATASLSGSSPTVNIGIDSDGTSNAWAGLIDDIKIRNGTRTASQIIADSNARGSANGVSVNTGTYGSTLGNGLVGYWKMDESSWTQDCSTTSVSDSSGNGNNGKSCPSTTGPSTTASGKFMNAGSFDGIDDYVSAGTVFPTTGSFSVSTWVNPTSVGSDQSVISSTNLSIYLSIMAGGAIRVQSNTLPSATTCTSNNVVSAGSWQLITGVFDQTRNEMRVYYNGQIQTICSTSGIRSGGSPTWILGIQGDTLTTRPYGGSMDEVRSYNRALDGAEISSLYDWAPPPVARWKMDEGSGSTTNDSSGNNLTGTLTTIPTWTTGQFGKAINFSPANSYVSVAHNTVLNITGDVTYEAWVKPVTIDGTARIIFGKGTASANTTRQYVLRLNTSNRWEAVWYSGSTANTVADSTVTPSTSRWDHIAAVRDSSSSTLKIYINGILTNTTSSVTGSANTTSDIFAIGREGTTSSNYFGGLIDDVRIYNYARNAKQIQQDMNGDSPSVVLGINSSSGNQNSKPGTAIGYWKFDEGYSTTAHNSGSGSSLDGTLTNMASPATSSSGWTNSGKLNKGIVFDGTNDYVTVGNQSSLNPTGAFTVSAWVKPSSFSASSVWNSIVGKYDDALAQRSYLLFFDGTGQLIFRTSNNGASGGTVDINTGYTAITGSWIHVTGTYDGVNMRAYVNGKQVGSSAAQSSIFLGTAPFVIGGHFGGGSPTGYFSGSIDEVKMYNYGFSANEIQTDFNRSSAQVFGSSSTESDGVTSSSGQDREYCVPGDTSSCSPPVAEYKLDERSGTITNDSSGNGYNGSLSNSPTWVIGKYGSSVNFNGTNQKIIINPNNGLSATTGSISAWVYPTVSSPAAKEMIVQGNRDTSRIYLLRLITSGNLGLSLGSTQLVDSGVNIPPNTWSYVSMTWNAGTYVLYFNGRQVATGAYSGMGTLDNFSVIGSYSDLVTPDSFFNGRIDQVRMYNYARTAAQTAWDYNRGGPALWWKMDECTGSSLNDAGGNGLTGTITIGGSGSQTAIGDCNTAGTAWGSGATGMYGSSLNLDGTDDYLTIANNAIWDVPSAGGQSVAIWFKTTSSTRSGIISSSSSSNWILDINQSAAGKVGYFPAGVYSSRALNDGIWHQLVVTRNGTSFSMYVDGILDQSGTTTAYAQTLAPLYVGSDNLAAGRYLAGQVDDLKIFNYPLTAQQVAVLYNQGSSVRFGP
jgi:hypothetical protein